MKIANTSVKRERTLSNSNSRKKVEEKQKEELKHSNTIELGTMNKQLSNSASTNRKGSNNFFLKKKHHLILFQL
jgi:hypothetical protein